MKPTRAPRFRRDELRDDVEITPRDLDILALIEERRFARSDQIVRVVPGSPKKIIERLGELFRTGHLDRPRSQLVYYKAGGGSEALVYAIGDRGARVLIEHGVIPDPGRLSYTQKNNEVGRLHIEHTLGQTEIVAQVIAATRDRPDLALTLPRDLAATLPDHGRNATHPFKLTATLSANSLSDNQQQIEASIIPDVAFRLRLRSPTPSDAYFLVEVDRGTEPIKRSNLKQTSVVKKMLVYEFARLAHVHQTKFNWHAFRVLIATSTPSRAASILDAIKDDPALKASPLFWVTDMVSLAACHNILHHPWQRPNGITKQLLPGTITSAAALSRM